MANPDNDGTIELMVAVRNVLVADDDLDGVDVYTGTAPREASNPHLVLSLPGNHREGQLGRGLSYRMLRMQVKAVASEADGVDGLELARTVADRALHILTNVVTTTPETKLNAHLTSWAAMTPLEDGPVGPFIDSVPGEADDTTFDRWHCGNFIRFGLSPL